MYKLNILTAFRHGLHPFELKAKVEATKDELQATMLQPDGALKQSPTLKKLDELMKSKTIELQPSRTREQYDSAPIKTSLAAFIKMVIANLDERFDNSKHNSIFEVAKIFMPENLPSDPAMLVNYGAKEVFALASFYKISPDPIEIEALEDEWRNFKFEVLRNCRHAGDNWRKVLTIAAKRESDWPTLSAIARAILSFNAENATVERGFSLLARLKTPSRNRLLPFTCDKLMRLRLNAESYKTYDYSLAYSQWLQSTKRYRYNAKSRGFSAFSSQPNMPTAEEEEEILMAEF